MSVTPTPSELAEVRAGALRRPGLVGPALREALTEGYDGWLRGALPGREGVALAAVGGLGRREPAPFSDLDLVLLYEGRQSGIAELADALWYPIWDSGLGLDHSVRTVDQAATVARDDLKAQLGLLDLRHVAGDAGITARLRDKVLDVWRATAAKRVAELRAVSQERWQLAGEGAFLLEPNLKDSRGGLRDGQLLRAFAIAQLVDYPTAVREAYRVLLDVRGELHRFTGRGEDVLRLQEHDGVALALGLRDDQGGPDRDRVLRTVNEAARTISHGFDTALRRIEAAAAVRQPRRRLFGGTPTAAPERVGLAKDVVSQDGEVVLARDADPWADPALLLRAARAAAEHDLPLSPFALERFATESAPVPEPWPEVVRDEFLSLLGAGHAAVRVLEALDLAGLLVRLIPEWDAVRCRAQHNPVHRFTVDRHLLETAAYATRHTREVSRPDLLLVGALLHDLGKGYPGGDHSVVGAVHAERIAKRMGFPDSDVATVVALTRHHLLLPDTATRRDLDDPMTITTVVDAVGESTELLGLLHALTVADAAATGPAAWSDWKAGLIAELVGRTRATLHGASLPSRQPPLDDERLRLAEAGQLAVRIRGDEVVVAAPDSVGVLYRTAGVLALHALDVRSASIHTHEGMAVNSFVVEPRFGRLPDPALVRSDLARALEGQLGLADRLRDKERAYGAVPAAERRAPTVLWFDDAATDATVLEFRAEDSIGLLCRVTAALERCGLDVRSAKVSSLGGAVVDAFYVTTRDGRPVPAEERKDIEQELALI